METIKELEPRFYQQLRLEGFVHVTGLRYIHRPDVGHQFFRFPVTWRGSYTQFEGTTVIIATNGEVWCRVSGMSAKKEEIHWAGRFFNPKVLIERLSFSVANFLSIMDPWMLLKRVADPSCSFYVGDRVLYSPDPDSDLEEITSLFDEKKIKQEFQ